MNRFKTKVAVFLASCALIAGMAPGANAAGKKKKTPANGCTIDGDTGLTTPSPVRKVVLRPVTTKAFTMPNGSNVDLTADLDLLLTTAVATTQVFAPTDHDGGTGAGVDDPCGNRIEIRGGVSTMMLNAFELGVSFGYSPSGDAGGGLTGVTGKTKLRVGTIAMDFSVWECTNGTCSAVAASTASALTTGVDLTLEVDFAEVKTSADLVFNSPLGNILRKIMNEGVKELAKSNRLSELSWTARVREYIPEAGALIFDAGLQERLAPNQSFVVYAKTPASGVCDVYKPVAHVHTTQVEAVSSGAIVDRVLDARGIQDGDVVMIRPTATSKK